jgi:hypothetical protein
LPRGRVERAVAIAVAIAVPVSITVSVTVALSIPISISIPVSVSISISISVAVSIAIPIPGHGREVSAIEDAVIPPLFRVATGDEEGEDGENLQRGLGLRHG